MKRRNKLLLLFALTTLTSVGTRAWDESVFTSNTLFIEAEDADFGHGKYVTDKKIGMDGPYPGGAYNALGTVDDLDFDWHTPVTAPQDANSQYRPDTGLTGGKHNGTAGNNRGTFQVSDWWTLGWTSANDWMNYTRTFPAAATDYAVFGHLASGGSPINIELDQITAGVGQDDTAQVKQKLGSFNPGRATAGWDSLELFPLTDDNGKLVTVKLGGKVTLRAALQPSSNEDLDYFAFVPVSGPLFSAVWSPAAVNLSIVDTTSAVDKNSIAVKVNGTAVSGLTFNQAGGTATASYTFPSLLAPGSANTLEATYKDAAGKSYTSTSTYNAPNFITLDPATSVTPDKTKTGFIWNFSTVDSVGSYAQNSNARTDAQLQGLLGDNTADPNAQGVALAVATPPADTTAPFKFEIDGPIDLEKSGAAFGKFPTKTGQMPGSPGINGTSNQAAEALTFLDLAPGYYTMSVASDDNFRVTTGANVHDAFATKLGEFDAGGRGYADTFFSFAVSKAGVYPFRLTWENGGGGSNVEWYSVAADGTNHLVGDKDDPAAIKAYRAAAGGGSPAYVKSFSPTATTVPAPSTKPNVNIVLADADTKVDKASVTLKVAGASVTPTITQAAGLTTIDYTATTAFGENTAVPVEFSFKDDKGAVKTVTASFTTEITTNSFPAGTLFIEAEDADYGHGQYVKNAKIGMDGAYPGGSYNALGTADDKGFDWFADSPNGQTYRPDTSLSAGKENTTQGSDRGTFQVTDAWTLGWNDANEWYNYTRDFPAGPKNYNVYGHLASGGAPINIKLDQITAGQGKADVDQVKKTLGFFNPGRATAGWDNLEIFPLVDSSGKQAVLSLGGNVTLRATMQSGSAEDLDYFAFVPTTDTGGGTTGGTTAGAPKLSIAAAAGGNVTITSDKGGTIEGSAKFGTGATWTTVGPAPQTVPSGSGTKFFRTKN